MVLILLYGGSSVIDQLETIADIDQGFDELNAGQTRPIREFVEEMPQKYGISG